MRRELGGLCGHIHTVHPHHVHLTVFRFFLARFLPCFNISDCTAVVVFMYVICVCVTGCHMPDTWYCYTNHISMYVYTRTHSCFTRTSSKALVVDDHLRVKGCSNMFALGDCAQSGLPATAQVASQQGRYLGRLLNAVADAAYADKTRLQATVGSRCSDNNGNGNSSTNRNSINNTDATRSVTDAGELDGSRRAKQMGARGGDGDRANGDGDKVAANVGGCSAMEEAINAQRSFTYVHRGSLAYVGTYKAIADFHHLTASQPQPQPHGGEGGGGGDVGHQPPSDVHNEEEAGRIRRVAGVTAFALWRSVYLTNLLSARNRYGVATDWIKTWLFGRDTSRG